MTPSATVVRKTILKLLENRGEGKTICPSEVARAMSPDTWRPLMPLVRETADKLAKEGRVRVTQQGQQVDATTASGPLRIALFDARQ